MDIRVPMELASTYNNYEVALHPTVVQGELQKREGPETILGFFAQSPSCGARHET